MSSVASLTGQLNIVDPSNNKNKLSLVLEDLFSQISGVSLVKKVERSLIVGDGTVSLPADGITSIKGFLIACADGSITLKHGANAAGQVLTAGGGLILFGSMSSITIETSSATAVEIVYAFFG